MDDYFIILHLGVHSRPVKPQKLAAKKQLLKQALQTHCESSDSQLVHALYLIEQSGICNAGNGCNLTVARTAELEASFLAFEKQINYASVCGSTVNSSPSEIARQQCYKQQQWRQNQHLQRPPLLIFNPQAFSKGYELNALITQTKLKKTNKQSDTVGGILVTKSGECYICTSSGGPSNKESGRVGSAALKGAGFDFRVTEDRFTAAVATGHGENIIEHNVCQLQCTNNLETKELLIQVGALNYDLAVITVKYQEGKVQVDVVSTGAALIYGFARKSKKAKIQHLQKSQTSKYICEGFNFKF